MVRVKQAYKNKQEKEHEKRIIFGLVLPVFSRSVSNIKDDIANYVHM